MRFPAYTVSMLATMALAGCSRPTAHREPTPSPSPREVYVVVTATPVPADAAPVEPAPVAFEHAEQTFRIPVPESGGAPQNEVEPPPAESAPRRTLYEEMGRCLTFALEKDGAVAVSTGVQLKVTARNQCATSFAASDLRVEVRARPWSGSGVAAREIIGFQGNIAPYDSALTFVVLHCDPDKSYRFEASPWPSAGSGRRLGQ